MRSAASQLFLLLWLIIAAIALVAVDAQYFDRQLSPQSRNFLSSRTQQRQNRNYNQLDEEDVGESFQQKLWESMEKIYPSLARLLGVTDDEEKRYTNTQHYLPTQHNVPVTPTFADDEPEIGKRQGSTSRPCGTGVGTMVNITESICPAQGCRLTKVSCDGALISIDGTQQNQVNLSTCQITEVDCNGTILSWPSTENCFAVLFTCSGSIVTKVIEANSTSCNPLRLFCNGSRAVNLQPPPPNSTARCPRDQLRCGAITLETQSDLDQFKATGADPNTDCTLAPSVSEACTTAGNASSSTSECSTFVFVCNATVCEYQFVSMCAEACLRTVSSATVCRCPLDRIGMRCETSRPVVCEWTLRSPQPKCQPTGQDSDLLDIDPVCFVFSMQENIEWQYQLSCSFIDETPKDFIDDPTFSYFARVNNSYAISKLRDAADPVYETIMKVFNFNILSDKNASQILRLSAAQLEGKLPVVFNLSFPSIPPKYFAGGRLYFEVSIYTERHTLPGLTQKRYDRRFVDPVGAPRRFTSSSGVSAEKVVWIIIVILLGIGLVFGLFVYLRRRRAKRLQRLRKEKDH